MRNLSLECCTNSCSLPANKFKPTGRSLLRAATMRVDDASFPFCFPFSFFSFFFYAE